MFVDEGVTMARDCVCEIVKSTIKVPGADMALAAEVVRI